MNNGLNTTSAMSFERVSLSSTIDLLQVLLRRRAVFVACIALGTLAGMAYYLQAVRIYESRASLLLIQRRPEAVTHDQRYESAFDDYMATHRALIVSPMIVGRAIKAGKLAELESFAGISGADLEETIIEQLVVSGGPRDLGDKANNIMTLTFYGSDPDECPVVVRAVLDSYRAFLDETYRGMSNETLRLIGEARDLLKNDLQKNEDAYVEFRQQSPLVSRGTDEVNPLQDRLAAIENRRTDLLLRRAEIDGQLKSIEAARERNYDGAQMTAFVTSLRSELSRSSGVTTSTWDSELFQLTDRERQLLEHFGPNHPHVLALKERIAAVRQLQALPTAAHAEVAGSGDQALAASSLAEDVVARYLAYLRQERDWIDTAEELLESLYQREHDVAQELSSYQLKDERYRRTINMTQDLYEGVIGQLQEASLVKDFGGFDALVIADPIPGEKVSPRGKIVLGLTGMLGAFIGLACAVVAELRDKSLRSRGEIQSRLGLRVLAELPSTELLPALPADDVTTSTLSPLLYAHHQPGAARSEAIRGLRTSLLYNPNTAKLRILQLTSPSTEDDMGPICANLAISIAQLGHRVLLVDANLHRPSQHELFGIATEFGITSLCTAGVAVEQAIYDTSISGLSLLPAGPTPSDNAEVFTRPEFSQLLQSLRTQYDYVIVDSAPLLVSSDTCVLAAQVDGLILGIRPTRDSRYRAERAAEILASTGIRPIGAVLNGHVGTASWSYQSNDTPSSSRPTDAGQALTSQQR